MLSRDDSTIDTPPTERWFPGAFHETLENRVEFQKWSRVCVACVSDSCSSNPATSRFTIIVGTIFLDSSADEHGLSVIAIYATRSNTRHGDEKKGRNAITTSCFRRLVDFNTNESRNYIRPTSLDRPILTKIFAKRKKQLKYPIRSPCPKYGRNYIEK